MMSWVSERYILVDEDEAESKKFNMNFHVKAEQSHGKKQEGKARVSSDTI